MILIVERLREENDFYIISKNFHQNYNKYEWFADVKYSPKTIKCVLEKSLLVFKAMAYRVPTVCLFNTNSLNIASEQH